MAETPRRSFRISDDLYTKARRVAESHGEDLTPVVTEALAKYAEKGVKRIRKPKAKAQVEESVPASA